VHVGIPFFGVPRHEAYARYLGEAVAHARARGWTQAQLNEWPHIVAGARLAGVVFRDPSEKLRRKVAMNDPEVVWSALVTHIPQAHRALRESKLDDIVCVDLYFVPAQHAVDPRTFTHHVNRLSPLEVARVASHARSHPDPRTTRPFGDDGPVCAPAAPTPCGEFALAEQLLQRLHSEQLREAQRAGRTYHHMCKPRFGDDSLREFLVDSHASPGGRAAVGTYVLVHSIPEDDPHSHLNGLIATVTAFHRCDAATAPLTVNPAVMLLPCSPNFAGSTFSLQFSDGRAFEHVPVACCCALKSRRSEELPADLDELHPRYFPLQRLEQSTGLGAARALTFTREYQTEMHSLSSELWQRLNSVLANPTGPEAAELEEWCRLTGGFPAQPAERQAWVQRVLAGLVFPKALHPSPLVEVQERQLYDNLDVLGGWECVRARVRLMGEFTATNPVPQYVIHDLSDKLLRTIEGTRDGAEFRAAAEVARKAPTHPDGGKRLTETMRAL
ncbi:MAG: hypothetical protein VKI39_07815, partial [Synechococcus sp.]|nr:hypothetical protein [Synechococcus sp.]